jgi:hypothetical protein
MEGFEGEVAGLGLSDLLQLNARNRFSGCFRIRHDDGLGLIFFRDGEIVHAELGAKIGEEAVWDILEWQTGRFAVEPNVVTARRSIQKGVEHLLLDAHRVLDERRVAGRTRPPPASPPAPAAAPAGGAAAAVEAVRKVPGVANAVVLTREGRRVSADGYEAEVLTGQAVYLAMMAAEFGGFFQAGELRFASVQGSQAHLLVFATKSHYLGVQARPESEIGVVDAAIRAALGGR